MSFIKKAPVLIVAWRRPDAVLKVVNAIRQYQPSQVFIACDGPLSQNIRDVELVEKTRSVILSNIDWPCDVYRLFSSTNKGCKYGVSSAINWFFEYVESGIILEDDCVPNSDFFIFCENLLNYFKHDMRVWSISGLNLNPQAPTGFNSYYFSRYTHCWGWATWKDRWQYYDPLIKDWPIIKESSILSNVFDSTRELKYWTSIFDEMYFNSNIDTWDYQWLMRCLVNSGLTVIPRVNLVENIGFDIFATHTKINIKIPQVSEIGHINHTGPVVPCRKSDDYIFRNYYCGDCSNSMRIASLCKLLKISNINSLARKYLNYAS